MAVLRHLLLRLLWGVLALSLPAAGVAAEVSNEYQIKSVFVFNFSHFVEWPPQSFGSPTEPFIIGVLGNSPFGARLDEAVRGEQIDQHPLSVHYFRSVADIGDCRILYIDRSEEGHLHEILAALNRRAVLTVSDFDRAAEQGVMIQFATENNRVRLRINAESARAAGLTVSSKLLRPAEIVGASGEL